MEAVSIHELAHPGGELATVRAAGAAGRVMVLSTPSNTRVALVDDLEWLRSVTELPLVIEGIVRPDDAVRAADRGADST